MKIFNNILYMLIVGSYLFKPRFLAAKTQEVTILADNAYPPYSFVEDGKAKGIYVDIIKEAAKRLVPYYKIKLITYPWKRALHEIKKGTAFAIIPPYQHISKRPYIWPYSLQILKEEVIAFCNKDIDLLAHINASSAKDSPPIIIGINAGYLLLNKKLEQAKLANKIVFSENRSTQSNIMKLISNRIDCYLNDKYSTYHEFARIKKEGAINVDGIKESFLIMIQTGHIGYTNAPLHPFLYKDDFVLRMDEALSQLKSSDTYQNIIDRYTIR
jgi:polar amino acid transport system substrate-binding protein